MASVVRPRGRSSRGHQFAGVGKAGRCEGGKAVDDLAALVYRVGVREDCQEKRIAPGRCDPARDGDIPLPRLIVGGSVCWLVPTYRPAPPAVTGSMSSLRPTNPSASQDGPSSHCASSTTNSAGFCERNHELLSRLGLGDGRATPADGRAAGTLM